MPFSEAADNQFVAMEPAPEKATWLTVLWEELQLLDTKEEI
jgi:hypothetical protein